MYACMYVCMYVSVYVCMLVCMHACMYVCMYVSSPLPHNLPYHINSQHLIPTNCMHAIVYTFVAALSNNDIRIDMPVCDVYVTMHTRTHVQIHLQLITTVRLLDTLSISHKF